MNTLSNLRKMFQAACRVALGVALLSVPTAPAGAKSDAPVVVDVTNQVSLTFGAWKLNRSNGALTTVATVKNNGQRAMLAPFRFALTPSNQLRLTSISGTASGMTYLDVTSQIAPQLPRTGNHDAKLDRGESATFAVTIFTATRAPIRSAHFLSQLAPLVYVSVAPDVEMGTAYAGDSNPVAVFTRSGDPSAGPLTVFYTTGGTATAGTDYTAQSGSVTFLTGESTASVEFPTEFQEVDGIDLSLTVDVTSNTNYNVGFPPEAVLIIHQGFSQGP